MMIESFFDPQTSTLTYIVFDPETKDAVIIDPVLDYNQASSAISFENMNKHIKFIEQSKLKLHYILETHVHADHLSSSHFLKLQFPKAKSVINKKITIVQDIFNGIFNTSHKADGSQFDILLNDHQELTAGSLSFKAIFTPGHTPACLCYLIEDSLFTGDSLFMPDFGTGRCDFPAGSSSDMFDSIQKLYALPDETKVYVGHDYQPGGRELLFQTTIGEQKQANIHLKSLTSKDEFVRFRSQRDKQLSAPQLLLPSIQINMNAGKIPPTESNGVSYIRLPIYS